MARHLLSSEGWDVRALTRDPGKPAANVLADAGVELFQADNDDPASLAAAFRGAYGVFSVQDFWLPNVEPLPMPEDAGWREGFGRPCQEKVTEGSHE